MYGELQVSSATARSAPASPTTARQMVDDQSTHHTLGHHRNLLTRLGGEPPIGQRQMVISSA